MINRRIAALRRNPREVAADDHSDDTVFDRFFRATDHGELQYCGLSSGPPLAAR